jgi:hypothetical protein
MKHRASHISPGLLSLLLLSPTASSAAEDTCARQADIIIGRLQSEVVGELDAAQRAAVNRIVLDACGLREQAVDTELAEAVEIARQEEQVKTEAAVEQARQEEREKAEASGGWFSGSGDKAGNDRLKRRGSY